MAVDYAHFRPVEGAEPPVDAAREVYILGIHEKALVKSSADAQRVGAQKHEAALMIGDVAGHRRVDMSQQVALAAFTEESGREEAADEDVGRSGEHAAGVLIFSVRAGDEGLESADIGIRAHEIRDFPDDFRLKFEVGIENYVKICPVIVYRPVYRYIMARTIAAVGRRDIDSLIVYIHRLAHGLLRGIIDNIDLVDSGGVDNLHDCRNFVERSVVCYD